METHRWPVLVVLAVASLALTEVRAESYTKMRSKRDLMELGKMIGSVTGKSLYSVYTSYKDYGCYCGLGGKGTAVDGIDRCCQRHDRCFGEAQSVCSRSGKTVYNVPYQYKIKDSKGHGSHKTIDCAAASSYKDMAQGFCSEAVCKCDRDVASCFTRNKYNSKYSNYDKNKCK